MEKVECVVVGGGLAGLSAAYGLADAGLEVMVLERGDYAGAKNVTGGRMYVSPLRDIYPELWAEAPFERAVAHEYLTMIGDGSQTTVDVASSGPDPAHPQSYTVIRAKLDRWLADRVADKGAMVLPKMKVDALLRAGADGRSGRVIGIRSGDDEIAADVVVLAEGVLGRLGAKAGLRAEPQASHHALGYKEVIELPPNVIEDRWHLNPGEGAAQLFMGTITHGMVGGGFLYTNKESISVGMVLSMDALCSRSDELHSWQVLDEFQDLAGIRPLVAGGQVVEYSAHAIAEGGYDQVPQLYGDGYVMVGDAAGLSLNALVTVRGMDLAVGSGYHAAQAVIAAKKAGDTSSQGLARYERRLRESFVLRDLETGRANPTFMRNPRLLSQYPAAASRLLEELYAVGPGPARKLSTRVLGAARRDLLRVSTVQDLWSMRKI
jgi:electron transfer flavoprotein-quinone oxidoreductase